MGMQMPGQLAPNQMVPMQPQRTDPAALDFGANSGGFPMAMQLNEDFLQALLENDLNRSRQLLQQKADVNFVESGPAKRTPLIHILETNAANTKVETMCWLLKAKANVNACTSRRQTPMHYALQNYRSLPPPAVRLLLCHNADLNLADDEGFTPMDSIKLLARSQNNCDMSRLRQILNEATERPTIDIHCLEGQQVQRAFFADTEKNAICFSTESSIGKYSLVEKRVTFMKKLKPQQMSSTVKNIAVNPECNMIAVCLELMDTRHGSSGMQNVFIVWPNGRLSDEEPLKLSLTPARVERDVTACVMMSRCKTDSQILVGRLADGKTMCWMLSSNRSQIQREETLSENSGLCALSDSGRWIAVAEPAGGIHISCAGAQKYQVVAQLPRQPQQLSIQQNPANSTDECKLAMSCAPGPDGFPMIEVWRVSMEEQTFLYKLQTTALCHALDFCSGTDTHIIAGFHDGSCILYDLQNSATSMCHGSPGMCPVSVNHDRTLIILAAENYFRISKLSPYEKCGA